MQNFHCGDSREISDNNRKMLQDKSNAVIHSKNLDDSLNDDYAGFKARAHAQLEKDITYRHELKEQCEDNYRKAQNEYEESHAETSRYQQNYSSEQNQQDLQHKHDESVKLHNERESFKKDCDDFKEVQKALIHLEEERIESQSFEICNRSFVVDTERERKLKDKDELNDRMVTRMEAVETERQNREDDLTYKHKVEDCEKQRQQDVMDHDKHEEDKRDLRDGLLLQIEEHKQSARDEVQRDQRFCDQANALLKMEDQREEVKARKKTERDDKYYSDLRQQIVDNAVRRQKQKEEDAK